MKTNQEALDKVAAFERKRKKFQLSIPKIRYTLNLYGTGVTDVSALVGLIGLHTLDLSHTRVKDVSALADCPGLRTLTLRSTGATDVSALAGLTGLRIRASDC